MARDCRFSLGVSVISSKFEKEVAWTWLVRLLKRENSLPLVQFPCFFLNQIQSRIYRADDGSFISLYNYTRVDDV